MVHEGPADQPVATDDIDIAVDLNAVEAAEAGASPDAGDPFSTTAHESSRYQKRSGHLPHGPEGIPEAHIRSRLPSPENIEGSSLLRGIRKLFGRA